MRSIVLAITVAAVAAYFAGDLVGFRPLKGIERQSTAVGLFRNSPVPTSGSLVENHGLGDGEDDEVLCERRTSFETGAVKLTSSTDSHVVVCRFKVTNPQGETDPSRHPYAYFWRDGRWLLAAGEGITLIGGPTKKLIDWPAYLLGNGVILAALMLALRFVRSRAVMEEVKPARPTVKYISACLLLIWGASGAALLYWSLHTDPATYSQIYPGLLPEALMGSLILAPLLEEVLFRGLVQESLQVAIGGAAAILVTAAAFALGHDATWGHLFSIFLSGLLFGWIRHSTGSLLLAISAHGLTNCGIVGAKILLAAGA